MISQLNTAKKILGISRDQGSIQAILPVVASLREKGCSVDLFVPFSRKVFMEGQCIEYKLIPEDLSLDTNPENLNKFLSLKKYDLVLTGSSPKLNKDIFTLEQILIRAAKQYRIPSISVLDYWGLYKERFFNSSNKIDESFIPDVICALDKTSKRDLVDLGIDSYRVKVTHNPWLDRAVKYKLNSTIDTFKIQSNCIKIIFASQPLRLFNDENLFNQNVQQKDLTAICDILEKLNNYKYEILVWRHPSEREEIWKDCLRFNRTNVMVSLNDKRSLQLLHSSQLFISYNSTLTYEALHLGVSSISLIPGSKRTQFYTGKLGLSPSISNYEDLESFFVNFDLSSQQRTLQQKYDSLKEDALFFSDGQATHKVLNEIINLLA